MSIADPAPPGGRAIRVGDLSEEELLAVITPLLPRGPQTPVGTGDDCAVLSFPDARTAVSTDVLVEGRHFRTQWSTGRDVGARAAAQNLADAAAMGATALWLGTHERNRRAQKAYKRRGFRTVGSRIYDVGGQACRDVVMSLNPQEVHDEH